MQSRKCSGGIIGQEKCSVWTNMISYFRSVDAVAYQSAVEGVDSAEIVSQRKLNS